MNYNWIQTFTGKRVFPLRPRAEDIDIRDIAHALSLKCRFGGHISSFYSVAQHSVAVSTCRWLTTPVERLWGLLHDAGEAYLPDIASPIKDRVFVSNGDPEPATTYIAFRHAENLILKCVAEKYDLSWPPPAAVDQADKIALVTEARDLLPGGPILDWAYNVAADPEPSQILPVHAQLAEITFLNWFDNLTDYRFNPRRRGKDQGGVR